MAIERNFPKLATNTTNIKPIDFLNNLQKTKKIVTPSNYKKVEPLQSLKSEINTTPAKQPSFFSDPKNITALRRGHIIAKKLNSIAPSDKLVDYGLNILDHIVCLENPLNVNADYNKKLALALFKQAARNNNAFAMYLVGAANIYGFCTPANIPVGLRQIKNSADKKCVEAKNFLGLLFAARGYFAMCCRMFQDSAKGGHPQAGRNLKKVTEFRQKLLARSRRALKHKELLLRQRKRRRQRQLNYDLRNVLTY